MTVIIARHTPDKVRGLLKRWFIEPKANVFVGSVNRKVREKVLDYLVKYSPDDLSFLVIFNDNSSQGFAVRHYNDPAIRDIRLSGHYLLTGSGERNEEGEERILQEQQLLTELPVSLLELLEEVSVRYPSVGRSQNPSDKSPPEDN